ncbi:MAG: VOC family protein [Candidatus Eremiobacteraeota bacterium]|nr:VOC family protein [Candidatus Eremiobacteraeota bacterium]
MDRPIFDHLDLRVRNLHEASPFYDRLMPVVGLNHRRAIGDHVLYYRKLAKVPAEVVVLFEDPAHEPTQSVVAFYAESYEEVDAAAAILAGAGAQAIEGPMLCPEYSETYYAVFFRDPSGNRLEVVCRRPTGASSSSASSPNAS